MVTILEYHLQSAEYMRNAVLQCRRAGMRQDEWSYYLSEMMRHSQAAIDKVVGRSRILRDTKDWL